MGRTRSVTNFIAAGAFDLPQGKHLEVKAAELACPGRILGRCPLVSPLYSSVSRGSFW